MFLGSSLVMITILLLIRVTGGREADTGKPKPSTEGVWMFSGTIN